MRSQKILTNVFAPAITLLILSIVLSCGVNKQNENSQTTLPPPVPQIKQQQPKGIAETTGTKEFEGKVIYDMVFEDKTGEITNEQAKLYMGTEQTYTIKGNKYKSEMNGLIKMTQTYLGQDTLYNQVKNAPNLAYIDVTFNPDGLLDFKIEERVESIQGVMCDLLTVYSMNGTVKYYFNKKYALDPSNFSKHEYGFWKLCTEQTKAIPLKSVMDTKEVYLAITAKELKLMNIADAEFQLPNLPRVENPLGGQSVKRQK